MLPVESRRHGRSVRVRVVVSNNLDVRRLGPALEFHNGTWPDQIAPAALLLSSVRERYGVRDLDGALVPNQAEQAATGLLWIGAFHVRLNLRQDVSAQDQLYSPIGDFP